MSKFYLKRENGTWFLIYVPKNVPTKTGIACPTLESAMQNLSIFLKYLPTENGSRNNYIKQDEYVGRRTRQIIQIINS